MSHYGPPSNGAAFPRGVPPFRPPQGFPRGPPPFRPPFAARGPPPFNPAMFRGPPPAFQARGVPPVRGPPMGMARSPMAMNMAPPMMGAGFQGSVGGSALPPGWSEHRTPQGATYYYNPATGVSTYEFPGQTEVRVPLKWVEYKDDATGAFYYFNTVTKETVWDQPEEFRMQKAREQVAKMTSEALEAASTAQTTQVQAAPQIQVPAQVKSAVPREQDEEIDEEERKRQESHELARKKKREEQEREQAAQFTDMPRAERMAAFKQFLEDKDISPTLKWGDAQRTISKESSMHSDPRWKFALNTVGEKKQAFAEYCTQAKNRATIEKRRLVKKAREEFSELLGLFENSLAPPSRRRQASWEDVANGDAFFALRKDPRWSAIEDTREKQQLFATFMQDLERSQKARNEKRRDALRTGFLGLLRERVESKKLDLVGSRSSSGKHLDSDVKRQVLGLLEEVELPDTGGKLGEDALRIVDRHDVYDWTEEFLRERRELERARRKRERVERAERKEKLGRELNELLKGLVASSKLTSASTWMEFSVEHLTSASEAEAKEKASKNEKEGDDDDEEEGRDNKDEHGLNWRMQRNIFDKFVKRLRRKLVPAASVIRAHLARSGDPPLRVTETTTYAVFADALESGVSVSLEKNALEEGEEGEDVPSVSIEENDANEETGSVKSSDGKTDIADDEGANESKKLAPEEVEAALEAAVRKQLDQKTDTADDGAADTPTTVEFPAFVRQVFDMWVAEAREDSKREEEKKSRRRKRGRKASRDLGPEDDEEDRPRRSRRRSSAGDEPEDDKKPKKHRGHRSSRKRRRSHGSPSASQSKSRSRSETRRELSQRRRRDLQNRSRSRDRDGALPPSLAEVVVKSSKPDGNAVASSEYFSPLLKPRSVLTEAEEAARAEEIIRQARLKLQAKGKSSSEDSELEEGEEVEEGEELEE